ncbi:MAG: tRNA (adenosine(37)-N6)-threonylcarbamoyltransferase complex dimerization subunit type 1 TsaB, partial [candidate division WOR-3 bacterium]
MPVFLGIDTSGYTTQVALVENGQVLHEESCCFAAGHNEVLVDMVCSALKSAGGCVSDLAGVGVTIGPGMFTSLRVG